MRYSFRKLSLSFLIPLFFSLNPHLQANGAESFSKKTQLATFEKVISKEQIQTRLKEIASLIDQEMQGEELTLLFVMKGGLMVTADLMRHLETPCTLEYVQTSSYGANGKVRGELVLLGLDRVDVKEKHVLIIDDVFDSGVTLATVVEKISALKPRSVRSLVLLSKNIPHKVTYRPDYTLFDIEDLFVVGYGMDYKEHWRELPDIYAIQ